MPEKDEYIKHMEKMQEEVDKLFPPNEQEFIDCFGVLLKNPKYNITEERKQEIRKEQESILNRMTGTLWLCGQITKKSWDFQGIFDSEEKAIEACKTIDYFIAPVVLNEEVPKESSEFKDAYFPLLDLIGLNMTEIEFIPVKED